MIVTVTANTTMDLTLYVPALIPNTTLRATRTVHSMGGKPTDASWILGEMGLPSLALGFAAGTIGERIKAMLHAQGVTTDFIPVGGESRINAIIISGEGTHTSITTSTLEVTAGQVAALRERFMAALPAATCVVLGGTLPAGLSPDFYTDMIGLARGQGVPVIFDADEPNLSAGLAAGPTFIKPNRDELARLMQRPIASVEAAYQAGREIVAQYGSLPVISLGEDGLLAVLPDKAWYLPPLPVEVVSPAGAGDAILAGLAAAVARGQSLEQGLQTGVAAATAVLLQPGTAVCMRADIEAFLPQVIMQPYP
ncbi:MAG: 1-phosphofructokinase family hexose kinase [Anaerolineae bacterium]|nr:1-phosphofructokinase family hexose kinase [Anaerolineae bacterium]